MTTPSDDNTIVPSYRYQKRELITTRLNPICALLVRSGAKRRGITESALVDELVLNHIAAHAQLDADELHLLEATQRLSRDMAGVDAKLANLCITHTKSPRKYRTRTTTAHR